MHDPEISDPAGWARIRSTRGQPIEPFHVDPPTVVKWIARRTGLDETTVGTVMAIEHEYTVATGIAYPIGPDGERLPLSDLFEFVWYQPDELDDQRPGFVDCDRIARDAERMTAIPMAVAHLILNTEGQYLLLSMASESYTS